MTIQKEFENCFVDLEGERWLRIENYHHMDPFFMALVGDSDLWAFCSTNGSLAAGKGSAEQSFFPYETVDKIHDRSETVGPRTWVLIDGADGPSLWEPFVRRPGVVAGKRSIYKNKLGTKILWEEIDPSGRFQFRQQWSMAADLGLVRKVSLVALKASERVRVLDGLLSLNPPAAGVSVSQSFSNLVEAYCWNEAHLGGQLGVFSMYAQIWDKAEPKETWEALTVWNVGVNGKTLISRQQVEAFIEGDAVESESLIRGKKPAYLTASDSVIDQTGLTWYQVINSPLSQARVADLKSWLSAGNGQPGVIEAAISKNSDGVKALLLGPDGIQRSNDEMAAWHHTANVLFNVMRGGTFADGLAWNSDDLLDFFKSRNRGLVTELQHLLAEVSGPITRSSVLKVAKKYSSQVQRLILEYLPLTFSRRHGDPSRPWNRFSIKVRNDRGERVINFEGNWRDIFQNWEALIWSYPDYVESVLSVFLSSMTVDGYNPYRISRKGIDWEVPEPDDPWSFIGYWGDHQVVYLLKFLEFVKIYDPELLNKRWHDPIYSFANVPYRIKSFADILANPKSTIDFDWPLQHQTEALTSKIGSDGRLVLDGDGTPVLGSLAEKLVTIILSKAGNLVPGGGIWLNTQRPEWNDANNALVGQGSSIVTLAWFRRFLTFILSLAEVDEAISLPVETSAALEAMAKVLESHTLSVAEDPHQRFEWVQEMGLLLERWRTALYAGWKDRQLKKTSAGLLRVVAEGLLKFIDKTLLMSKRPDGLYDSYNVLAFSERSVDVHRLYPMLEGQVAVISSGFLKISEALQLSVALKQSAMFDPRRNSYMLYPDRQLPGFLDRNVLDEKALQLPSIRRLLTEKRFDVLEVQQDGVVRFAAKMANRFDVEQALRDWGKDAQVVAAEYERLMNHREFTGRSGTMFAFEGLGCIYWHMVAKLLLSIQELVFQASDASSPELPALIAWYRDVRSGLGYKRRSDQYGAFPFDPYSHTPAGGGAQQPGMTGQVKEEVLTRWGELGLRWNAGKLIFNPVLFEIAEISDTDGFSFTYRQIPFRYVKGNNSEIRIRNSFGWQVASNPVLDFDSLLEVEVVFSDATNASSEHQRDEVSRGH